MAEDKLPQLNIQVPKGYRYRQYLAGMRAAGGRFYVRNCQPQSIPAECSRLDCPMRRLAMPPEAHAGDYLLECDPPGFLADLLIMVRAGQAEVIRRNVEENFNGR